MACCACRNSLAGRDGEPNPYHPHLSRCRDARACWERYRLLPRWPRRI
jgi:hypothetical protein